MGKIVIRWERENDCHSIEKKSFDGKRKAIVIRWEKLSFDCKKKSFDGKGKAIVIRLKKSHSMGKGKGEKSFDCKNCHSIIKQKVIRWERESYCHSVVKQKVIRWERGNDCHSIVKKSHSMGKGKHARI
ncbi:MAG: hypothetical protein U9N51_06565 [Bacteroidota bacterium]|nr:hypothetical protein [Bacteroidota bacterium]